MSSKRKPNEENRRRQKPKSSFKSSLVCNHSNSSNFRSNLRENCSSLGEVEFCADFPRCKSQPENFADLSGFEDDLSRSKDVNGNSTPNHKKKKNVCELNESHVTTTKNKCRKEPLPMKFRAFPQSFWQQPNKTASVSPGNVYCVPPPLSKEDSTDNRETLEEVQPRRSQEIVSKPNIDLLFSLFRNVEEEQQKALGHRNAPLIRRGRPKKSKTESKVIRDDDPYLTSSAAESLLPLLPVRSKRESLQYKIAKDEQILAMVSIDGSSSTMLTSVNSTNQNYSQILSELVVQL